MREGEFEVFYQPLVQFDDSAVVGFEALLRWRHPTRGLLNPGEFLDRAEASGLIVPIGSWVINEVCRQAAAWRATRLRTWSRWWCRSISRRVSSDTLICSPP